MLTLGLSMWTNTAAMTGPAATGSAWDMVALGAANYTFSGTGNMTATRSVSGSGWYPIIGTAAKSSGIAKFTRTVSSTGSFVVGLADSSVTVGGFPGQTSTSIGYFPTTGTVSVNNATVFTGAGAGIGDVVEWDYDGTTATLKINGTTIYSQGFAHGALYPCLATDNTGWASAEDFTGW